MSRRFDEFLKLVENLTPEAQEAIEAYAAAYMSGDSDRISAAFEYLGRVLGGIMSVSELAGRIRTLHEARIRGFRPETLVKVDVSNAKSKTLPPVVFEEAIQDLYEREPYAREAGIVPKSISDVWASHGFALAKSSSMEITKQVQQVLGQIFRHHEYNTPRLGRDVIQRVVGNMQGWTNAYAENIMRTTGATVYTAGRFMQVSDPAVKKVIPAFRFSAVRDADVRENHAAAHGMVAGVDDPIWDLFAPPLGFNCRCDLVMIDRYELQKMGLLDKHGNVTRWTPVTFGQAHADPGFSPGGRRRSYAT